MSKLIKRDYVIELIKNSHYDLINSEDDMWAMVADVEKLPVIETEDLFRDEKDNGLKENFGDMDTQIDSVIGNLEWIQDECDRAMDHMKVLEIQYERFKKYRKQLQEKVDNLETFDLEFEYCPHCDSKIYAHNDYEYCPYCGEKLD